MAGFSVDSKSIFERLCLSPATAAQYEVWRQGFEKSRSRFTDEPINNEVETSWELHAHRYLWARRNLNFNIEPADVLRYARYHIIVPASVVITGDPGENTLHLMDGYKLAGRRDVCQFIDLMGLRPKPQTKVMSDRTFTFWSAADLLLRSFANAG